MRQKTIFVKAELLAFGHQRQQTDLILISSNQIISLHNYTLFSKLYLFWRILQCILR